MSCRVQFGRYEPADVLRVAAGLNPGEIAIPTGAMSSVSGGRPAYSKDSAMAFADYRDVVELAA